jgi:lipopolysaccharide export system protein LptC
MDLRTIGPPTEDRRLRAFSATPREDSERAFVGARRHSRRVRILRGAVPVAVVLCLAGIAAAKWLNPLEFVYRLPNDAGTLVISGTKVRMEQPRIAGFTRDARAYEVNARAAAQDLTNPSLVELQEIRAKLDMPDKSVMEMTARGGLYDAKAEQLTLSESILLTSSAGHEGRLTEAIIDIRTGKIVSNKPVHIKTLQGTLNANRLEVTDAGAVVRFEDGVAMVINPEKRAEQAAGAAQSTETK